MMGIKYLKIECSKRHELLRRPKLFSFCRAGAAVMWSVLVVRYPILCEVGRLALRLSTLYLAFTDRYRLE